MVIRSIFKGMSMRIAVKDFCESSGAMYNGHEIDTAYRLMIAVNLNSPTTAYQLWASENRKIGLDTLEELCRTLGCTPNDLFVFDPPLVQSTPAVRFLRANVDAVGRVKEVTGKSYNKTGAKLPAKKKAASAVGASGKPKRA